MHARTSSQLFIIQATDAGKRLDAFLAEQLKGQGVSRERIKKSIKDGAVSIYYPTTKLDSIEYSPKKILQEAEEIRLVLEAQSTSLTPEEGELHILYKDNSLAIINKPANLTVHPAPGLPTGTLAHRLLAHFPELEKQTGFRPGIVHRLDKDTSGLLIVALSEETRLTLASMFAKHTIYKEYLALVYGVPAKAEELITDPLGRHPQIKTKIAVVSKGKEAKSLRRTLYADPAKRFSLQAVRIFTGRTHQIRVHLAHIGHPLLGDHLYTDNKFNTEKASAPRQMLHAWKLSFTHPVAENIKTENCTNHLASQNNYLPSMAPTLKITNGNLDFTCPPPKDFTQTIRNLGLNMLRIVLTGSPGCGKSTVLATAQNIGLPVFSADSEVKRLYDAGGEAAKLLYSRYGDRFVTHEKAAVNKLALGAAMQDSHAFKKEIEAMVHPLVHAALDAFWQDCEKDNAPLAIAEIPLFLEARYTSSGTFPLTKHNNHYQNMDYQTPTPEHMEQIAEQLLQEPLRPLLAGVYTPFSIRQERMLQKRGWSVETIANMERWQWPEDKKAAWCDILIPNTGTQEELEKAVQKFISDATQIRLLRSELLINKISDSYR